MKFTKRSLRIAQWAYPGMIVAYILDVVLFFIGPDAWQNESTLFLSFFIPPICFFLVQLILMIYALIARKRLKTDPDARRLIQRTLQWTIPGICLGILITFGLFIILLWMVSLALS